LHIGQTNQSPLNSGEVRVGVSVSHHGHFQRTPARPGATVWMSIIVVFFRGSSTMTFRLHCVHASSRGKSSICAPRLLIRPQHGHSHVQSRVGARPIAIPTFGSTCSGWFSDICVSSLIVSGFTTKKPPGGGILVVDTTGLEKSTNNFHLYDYVTLC